MPSQLPRANARTAQRSDAPVEAFVPPIQDHRSISFEPQEYLHSSREEAHEVPEPMLRRDDREICDRESQARDRATASQQRSPPHTYSTSRRALRYELTQLDL